MCKSIQKKNLRKLSGILLFFFLTCWSFSYAQDGRTITGTVTDEDGNGLPGVNVVVKATNNGTITDVEGDYKINVRSVDSVLVYSFIGYSEQERPIGQNTEIDVTLSESVTELEEIVVVGFGTLRKGDITGAVSTIDVDEIQKASSPTVGGALQGRAAGVTVLKRSGSPGTSSNIKIRGITSINNTDPLIVVDGVRTGTNLEQAVNIEDIESISILKDAAAASIYGKDAANGVIIVTTKRGSKQAPTFRFHTYHSMDNIMDFPELMNTEQLTQALEMRLRNDFASFPPERLDQLVEAELDYYLNYDGPSTDWADAIFRRGHTRLYSLSATGGNDQLNYYISGNIQDQKGIVIASDYKKYSLRINTDSRLKKWIKLGTTFTYNYTDRTPLNPSHGNKVIRNTFRANPTMPVYDETNPYNTGFGYLDDPGAKWQGSNPVARLLDYDGYNRNNYLYTLVYAELQPFKSLTWRTNVSGTFNWGKQEDLEYPYYYGTLKNASNVYYYQLSESRRYDLVSFLTYNKSFNNHNLTVMGGMEFSEGQNSWLGIGSSGLLSTEVRDPLLVEDINTVNPNADRGYSAQFGYFSRINYDYNNKYLFQGNLRIDYSDKFGSLYNPGVFPSFSVGWRLSKENFFNLAWIQDLKLRAGWGVLGNDNSSRYLFASDYRDWGYTVIDGRLLSGSRINRIPNNSIKWEENAQANLGIDYALFRGRIQGSLEYYNKVSSDILIRQRIPRSTGFDNITTNVAQTKNTGIDFSFNYKNRVNNLSYSIGTNFNYNENEVLNLASSGALTGGTDGYTISRTEEGHPQSSFYGFIVDGIIQSQEQLEELNTNAPDGIYQQPSTAPGDFLYRDLNNDNHITEDDQTFIGNPWPKYTVGLNATLNYMGFDFTMLWTSHLDVDLYNLNKIYTDQINGDFNSTTKLLNAWSPENSDSDLPRLTQGDPNKNFGNTSSYFVEDGSFLRLKNIVLGYTLPANLTNTIKLKGMRIYVNATNPITITKYSGIDPEFVFGGNTNFGIDYQTNYPQFWSLTGGIEIKF